MSIGSVNAKTPVRSPTPKNNFPPPPSPWSKGCLRPHAPLRARQQGPPGTHSSTSAGTNPMGSPIPSSGSGLGAGDGSNAANESGSNRTLKRFMTMKKSKANEFLKRGKTFPLIPLRQSFDDPFFIQLKRVKTIRCYSQSSKLIAQRMWIVAQRSRVWIHFWLKHGIQYRRPVREARIDRASWHSIFSSRRAEQWSSGHSNFAVD